MKMNPKQLNIPKDWKINWNHFIDLNPDNNLPIDEVWICFKEDTAYFTNGNYFIDLGFYGGEYLLDRLGYFKVYIAEGDFHQGKLFETFVTRSTEEI